MNKEKSLFNYFSDGFALTNKSLEVYLIALVLTLIALLNSIFPNSPYSGIFSLLLFITTIMSVGFSLSAPVFLLQKHQNKPLALQNMLSTTIKNTRRIILPLILIFILFIVLFIATSVLTAIFLYPTKEQVFQFFQSWDRFSKGWHPIFLIPSILFSFFVFTPFFFSLEYKGLLVSIKKSVALSFRNLSYIALVALVSIISYSVTSLLPIAETWGLLLRPAITVYLNLVVTASTLFYYQKMIKA